MQPIAPIYQTNVSLADLTTLRLGGPARRLYDARSAEDLVRAVADADARGERVLLLGGGSNLVIGDEGFDGSVIRIATRGIDDRADGRIVVQAGEPWDDVVAWSIASGRGGIECLSGIPGSAGATPIQNVGAYGASVADVITRVRAFDRDSGDVRDLTPGECEFGYRVSRFKRTGRFVVLEVELHLEADSTLSAPIRYAELARRLDVQIGERAPLDQVRATVLELRRGKGMVVDPTDPDTASAGSFFTNPILSTSAFAVLTERVHARLGEDVAPPSWAEADGRIKTSAAWLIERAGFTKGYGDGRAGISSRHTLALVNRGGATTQELLSVAREVRDGVRDAFGVVLQPEPVLVGVSLDP